MLATGLLGVVVLAPSSASADVLCDKVVGGNYDCPAGNTYGVGAKFHAANNGVISLKTEDGKTIFVCAASELDMTVTNAGGSGFKYPEVDVTNLTLGYCGDDPTSFTSDGSALISPYSFSSLKGLFNWSGEQLQTTTNVFAPNWFISCTYDISGAGTLAGAKTEEGSELTRLVFNNVQAQAVTGKYLCPQKPLFSAKYDFLELEWPVGIYLARE